MSTEANRRGWGLTQNQLKMIGIVSMTVDHIGMILFPGQIWMRVAGRLAFPIFAYSIYEGCKYTKRPLAYLGRMVLFGLLCLLGEYRYTGRVYGNVLLTFSLSILILLAVRYAREKSSGTLPGGRLSPGGVELVVAAVVFAAVICECIPIDYGFAGVLLPVFPGISDWEERNGTDVPAYPSRRWYPLLAFSAGLLLVCYTEGYIQYFSLAALALLALSNGKRGTIRLKYFFYLYYPLHLAALELIAALAADR